MNVYHCDFVEIVDYFGSIRAKVVIRDNPDSGRWSADEVLITSKVKSIDFEKGVIITHNSIYLFDPEYWQ